jgi:hypothetical protein
MLAGLGVRALAPIQVFANLNYILAKTYSSPAANIDRLTIMILVVLSGTASAGVAAWMAATWRAACLATPGRAGPGR